MTFDHLRSYCLAKKGTTEEFPFDEDTMVFKVMGKIFVIAPLDRWEKGEPSMNLKADPEYSEELRIEYNSIHGGYHQNKKHWNTVYLAEGELKPKFVESLIDHSYEMVVKGMTKKMKEELNDLP